MDEKSKRILKKVLEYSLPSLITMVILACIFIIRGIYPFGSGSVATIDYYYEIVPTYTYLWDLLHGDASLFYTVNLGGGGNIFVSLLRFSLVCPIMWIVAIFPRASIAYLTVFIIVILFMLMALTTYIAFKKLFPNVNKYILLFFTIMWCFSAWTIVHFSNIGWLAFLVVFPLLILSINRVVTKNKIAPFVITFAYCLMLSYYLSILFLVALVIAAFMYIIFIAKEKKKTASLLVFGVGFAVCLAMVVLAPSLIETYGSYRVTGEEATGTAASASTSSIVSAIPYNSFGSKLFNLAWFPLPFILLTMYFIKHFKTDKKVALTFMIIISVLLSGLIFERINIMWHTGSYYSYPYRCAFTILFALILMSLYYLNNFDVRSDFKLIQSKLAKLNSIFFFVIFSIIFLVLCAGVIILVPHPYKFLETSETLIIVLVAIILGILYTLLLKQPNYKFLCVGVCTIALVSTLTLGVTFFGMPMGSSQSEHGQVTTSYAIDTSNFSTPYRIKDKDNILYPNYPLLIDYPSLSTWIHLSPAEQTMAYRYLGYNENGVHLGDDGGSLFTDLLLGTRYIISKSSDLSEVVYTKIDTFEYYDGTAYLYEHNFTIPFVQMFDKNSSISKLNDESIQDAQNDIYKKLMKTDKDILHQVPFSVEEIDGTYKITFTVQEGLQNLYFNVPRADIKYFAVKDGDKETLIENGLFDLGVYENETVEFTIIKLEDDEDIKFDPDELEISSLYIEDIEHMANTLDNNFGNYRTHSSGLSFTVTAEQDCKLFVPITCLKGYTVKINGEQQKLSQAYTSFISLDLKSGENLIEIKFTPPLLVFGLVVSVATALILIGLFFINRRFHLFDKSFIKWTGTYIGAVAVFAVIAIIFFMPFILTFGDIF